MLTIAVQPPPFEIRSATKKYVDAATKRTRSGNRNTASAKAEGDERQKLEEEPGEIEAAEGEVRAVEPPEPVQERAGEDDDRDHGRQGEQPRRDPVPREERPEREHEADRHREQGEQDEPRGPAVACEHAEQRARREENRDAAEVGEERRARPGHAGRSSHGSENGSPAGRRG